MDQTKQNTKQIILWILLAIYFLLSISVYLNHKLIMAIFLCSITFGVIHGSIRYGIKNILVFIAFCFGISFFLENVSVLTGFPFGHYYYTDILVGPKVLHVPIAIIFGYFSTGYSSWVLANILLDNADSDPKSNIFKFGVPVITAFIMTMWDVCIDPRLATILNYWIWKDGGGFFGVPLSNFIGWFFCVWLFTQAFALYLSRSKVSVNTNVKKSYWYQAITLYFLIAFSQIHSYIYNYFFDISREVTDATGKVWVTGDMRETAVILVIYTMMFVCVLSFLKVYRQNKN